MPRATMAATTLPAFKLARETDDKPLQAPPVLEVIELLSITPRFSPARLAYLMPIKPVRFNVPRVNTYGFLSSGRSGANPATTGALQV